MNKITYAIIALFLCGISSMLAQVGIGTTNPKSTLDILASNVTSGSVNPANKNWRVTVIE